MTAAASIPLRQPGSRGRLWWLPADGCGNGIDDDAWAQVLEVVYQAVPFLLTALSLLTREAARDAGTTWR